VRDLFTKNMFAQNSDLTVLRLGREDVLKMTEKISTLSMQVSKHEGFYPNINDWLKKRVLPGIKNQTRVAYLGLNNGKPVASAILKLSSDAKICHLCIDHSQQNRHLGDLFFSMMALDAKRKASRIHFTLPERLWLEKREFFKSFGFCEARKTRRQYRPTKDEMVSSVGFNIMWKNVLEKLPKIINALTPSNESIFNGILMSIRPEYIRKMQAGQKVVEVRKRFSTKWLGCRVTLYSSSPDQAIYGYATIEKIIKDTPRTIWTQYGDLIGVEKKVFDDYSGSSNQIYAIFLKDFKTYLNPVYLSHLSYLLNGRCPRPPESYISLEHNIDWSRAVSIAELLHNRFWLYTTVI